MKSKTDPVQVWSNAGAGGRAASIWMTGNLNLITVVPSHAPPVEAGWDILDEKFSLLD